MVCAGDEKMTDDPIRNRACPLEKLAIWSGAASCCRVSGMVNACLAQAARSGPELRLLRGTHVDTFCDCAAPPGVVGCDGRWGSSDDGALGRSGRLTDDSAMARTAIRRHAGCCAVCIKSSQAGGMPPSLCVTTVQQCILLSAGPAHTT